MSETKDKKVLVESQNLKEEKKKDRKVIIKRVERTKRKYVTVIQGLEAFSQFILSLS